MRFLLFRASTPAPPARQGAGGAREGPVVPAELRVPGELQLRPAPAVPYSGEMVSAARAQSLSLLQMDTIDLYQIHVSAAALFVSPFEVSKKRGCTVAGQLWDVRRLSGGGAQRCGGRRRRPGGGGGRGADQVLRILQLR